MSERQRNADDMGMPLSPNASYEQLAEELGGSRSGIVQPFNGAGLFYVYSRDDERKGMNESICWWKAKGCGYTADLAKAGLHSEEDWSTFGVHRTQKRLRFVPYADAWNARNVRVLVDVRDLPEEGQIREPKS